MNRKLIFAVAAASALLLSSCRKADEVTPSESQFDELEFTATIDGPSTKTTVNTNGSDEADRGKIEWEKGDTITITDKGNNSVKYVATNSGTTSTFRKASGQSVRLGSGSYTATYGTAPSTTQNYADHYKDATHARNVYMTAESPNRSLNFKAACGLLKLTLTAADGADESIKNIDVTGTLKDETKSTTYTLNCVDGEGNGVSIKDGTDFYLTLPAGTYTKMVFTNDSDVTAEYSKSGSSEMTIENNKIQPVTIKDVTFTKFYPGTELEGIKIGNVTWAPVNCGYDEKHTYGLLYQWGRMYGQDYDAGTITPKSLSMSDGQLESNSGKFGKYNTTNYNWFSGDIDNTLWNGSTKGTYDPCPSGWRVPTYGELKTLQTNKSSWTTNTVGGVEQNGYWFSGETTYSESVPRVFLPVAGYRNLYYGNAIIRGDYGIYWSSSVNGNYAWSLSFDGGYADMKKSLRANGFSVRCVQEKVQQ